VTKRLGLIVNPIAGMGGRVGLKGTDGAATVRRARELGAEPGASGRAVSALAETAGLLAASFVVLAAPAEMGEDAARRAGLVPTVVGSIQHGATTAEDTVAAARAMREAGVDLLVFVGGDGTARDVCRAVGEDVLVLGIPAGTKMHSAVYATTPRAAAHLIASFVRDRPISCRLAEVMDVDEEAYRRGMLSTRLYGYLNVPDEHGLVQRLKLASPGSEVAALAGIADDVVERLREGDRLVVGPGTTTRAIANRLGLPKTLLGVDVYERDCLIAADVGEPDLLRLVEDRPTQIVVTPIGGQGYLFGRGNQQISPAVIRRVGRANLLVVATPSKLAALQGAPLLVDTGDVAVDAGLAGYTRVVTGYRAEVVYRVVG
jgi:predicted polyphosphate/ATP-dependent NAD kinase